MTRAPLTSFGLVCLLAGFAACSSSTPATGADAGADAATAPPTTSVDCGRGVCPQDPAVGAAPKKICEDALASSCGGLYGLFLECVNKKVTCGGDGKTNSASYASALSACKAESSDYTGCASGDGGAGDSGR